MKSQVIANSDNIGSKNTHQKDNRKHHILFLLFVLAASSAVWIYAFLSSEVIKTDVSGPDPGGTVVVPENYQNLLVVDVTIPPYDAGRVGADIKVHNGVAGSSPRDVLHSFASTNWYSDHDGDTNFDGNIVSGNAEAIILSSDDTLDSNDTVEKTGLCLIRSFAFSGGIGEQYIDNNHSQSYTNGEAVVRTTAADGLIRPDEVVRSGTADMTQFLINIRFTDGINGSAIPAQYNSGEAIISSDDSILDAYDTVLKSGVADLIPIPNNIVYSDSDGNNRYGNTEAIIMDNGASGKLDMGPLDGTGVDKVIRTGLANLRPMSGRGLLFADDNSDNVYSPYELIVASPDMNVDAGEVKLSGLANLKPMIYLSFADDNNDSQLNGAELIIKNTGIYADILETTDSIVSPGNADLKAFIANRERFVDNDADGAYDNGECIVRDNNNNGIVEPPDIEKPGLALLLPFSGTGYLYTEHILDGKYTGDTDLTDGYQGEAIFSDLNRNGLIEDGELVTAGYADLKSFPANFWFVDAGTPNPGNGVYSSNEVIIASSDNLLSSSDNIIRSGPAFLTNFDENMKWADVDQDDQYDEDELIVNSQDNILSRGEVIRPGYCNLISLAGYYIGQLYSDNNGSNTYSNDELVIFSADTILDAGDTVSKPGKACLLSLKNFSYTRYIDTNRNRDFNPEEAVIYDPNADPTLAETILDITDRVVRSQTGVVDIKSFSDEVVYIDHNGNGYFKGDSDNDVTWGSSLYYANDPNIIRDEDEVVLKDPVGANHLALDSGDVVLRAGLALLTAFPDTTMYADDGDNGYDGYNGSEPTEAVIQGSSANPILDSTDRVIVTGRALIRDFNPSRADRYIDANSDGVFTEGEAIITDSGPGGAANGLLDAGPLDGTGTDRVVSPGMANLKNFSRAEKFVDGNHNGAYDSGEAIVHDWYDPGTFIPDTNTFVGEYILAGDQPLAGHAPSGILLYQSPGSRTHDIILLASEPNQAAMTQLNHRLEHKYIDYIHSGTYDDFYSAIHEPIIWSANNDLDEGNLDGSGTDSILACGYAAARWWPVNMTWADSNHDSQYQKDEAIVYDANLDGIITSIGPAPSKDQIMVPGKADLSDFEDIKYTDANQNGNYDQGELMVNDANQDNKLQDDEISDPGLVPADLLHSFSSFNHRYCDSDMNSQFDLQEAIVIDLANPGILEPADQVVAAGHAGLTAFSSMNMLIDYNHNGTYDENEAIIYGDGDQMMEDSDEIIISGMAASFDNTSFKYAASAADAPYSDGRLIVDDIDGDNILTGEKMVTYGIMLLRNFNTGTDRYADSDHNSQYDYNDTSGFGEVILVNTTGSASKVESSDRIETPGYADLQSLEDTNYRHSDADNNNEYTDGELIVTDLDADNSVDAGEIVRAGLANLKQFSADVMYADGDRDGNYSSSEAIIRTTDADLGSGDRVLATGAAGLHSFEVNIYRLADSDHNQVYDTGEAIVVETNWGTVDNILESSDIVILAGTADIEQFPDNFMFLDDRADSNNYENGEAIVNDSNWNNLLDPGEIITSGRAALRSFAGGEKYTDGGQGPNARNQQYNADEAIIRDGNSNNNLDTGPLNGPGNDTVLAPGKAGLMNFRADERFVDKNGNSKYDGGQYNSEDIYQDRDNNGIVTMGDDALEYFVMENTGTATRSDLAAVKLWADRDKDGQFEPGTHDAPSVSIMLSDASNPRIWYQGPATAPPLSNASNQPPINYTITTGGQRFFVTVDIGSTPTDGRNIQMSLPLRGVKTIFSPASPTDGAVTNTYFQEIDFANPHIARITSPEAGAVVNGQIVLRADAEDTMQVGKVEFFNGLPGGGNTPITIDDNGVPWEALWDTSALNYGQYTLYARVYDRTYSRPPGTWGIQHYKDSPGVTITVGITSTVQLHAGWNFISVPVEAFDTDIHSVLYSVEGKYMEVWAYDAITFKWLRYDLDGPEFLNDLNSILMGKGYWIWMSSPGTLKVNGARHNTDIQLYNGWNLVGCNLLNPMNIASAMASINGNFSVWTFDTQDEEWLNYDPDEPVNDLNTVNPGSAYWIYTENGGNWALPEE